LRRARPCPYRFVHKGRTFCAAAIRERRFTTNRVSPQTCEECSVPDLVVAHPCAHLDVGVEIDEYGPRAEVVFVHFACRVLVQELPDLTNCSPSACPMFEAVEEGRWEEVRERALARQRMMEDREA